MSINRPDWARRGAAKRADHAGCYGALKAVRIANRDHQLAGPDLPRVAERDRWKVWGIDANHGEIRIGIVAHQAGAGSPAIGESNIDARCAVHHVAVRQNEAVRCENESGTAAPCLSTAERMPCFDVDYRRTDGFRGSDDRARIGIQQLIVG